MNIGIGLLWAIGGAIATLIVLRAVDDAVSDGVTHHGSLRDIGTVVLALVALAAVAVMIGRNMAQQEEMELLRQMLLEAK